MARYLIDANLPRLLPIWQGAEYLFVHDIDPALKDSEIWRLAKEQDLTIVTKDADFSDRTMVDRGGPHVIHVRLGNMRLRDLAASLTAIWNEVALLSARSRLVQVYRDRVETVE